MAITAAGERLERPAPDWLQALPATEQPSEPVAMAPERVRIRIAETTSALRAHGEILGWVERFGKPRKGSLALTADALVFHGEDGQVHVWPLAGLTAVQPSSSTLQIKARGTPVVSLRFLEGSVRLWEDRIKDAVRRIHRAAGKGEILEFQPRITP